MLDLFTDEERKKLNALFNIDPINGNNSVLDRYMKAQRKKWPVLPPDKRYEVYQSNELFQLWLQTPPCRFAVAGKCTICNYWKGKRIPNLLQSVLEEVEIPDSCNTILINTCGSCLDPAEISHNELPILLNWLVQSPVSRIIFETHWTTLTPDLLCIIDSHLSEKDVMYEIGLESANPDTLIYLLNKPSSITSISTIIHNIHSHHATCIMNVVFGAPLLTPREQIADVVSSISFLLKHHVDYIVLFPINIKPNTLLMDLYIDGNYQPVPAKIISDILLDHFPENLDRINIAWFGDRRENGVVPPARCNICGQEVVNLFKQYNSSETTQLRRELLERVSLIKCSCTDTFLSHNDSSRPYKRVSDFYNQIKKVE